MKKYDELNRLLNYMEENVDLQHIANIERLQYDAINFKEIPYLPLTIRTTPDGYEQIPLEEAFNDPEKMLFNELLWSTMHSSYNSVRTKDDCPLMIRSNHGLGIVPTMFGCKTVVFDNKMPWVEHIEWDEAVKVMKKGVPDMKAGLAGQVVETYQYYKQRLSDYPKLSKAVRLTQPDMQGPYDIFHLVVGNEAFYSVYDEPEQTKEMLDVITQTYIDYRNYLKPYLYDSAGNNNDACFVHAFCVGGQVLVKCDTASANLSADMCEEFETVYVKRIIDAFAHEGGGSVHSCGEIRPDTMDKFIATNMKTFNFGNPEKHNVDEVFDVLQKSNIGVAGWGFNQFYNEYHINAFKGKIKTGMSLSAKSINVNDGIEILKRHRESYFGT